MLSLRPYQEQGIQALREAFASGRKALCFVLPTGGGKTVVAAAIIKGALDHGSRMVFVAHRRELIAQTYEKVQAIGVSEESMGIVMSGTRILRLRDGRLTRVCRPSAPIQICSIDTLRNRDKPPADIVFIDEAHRCLAPSYLQLKEQYPDAIHIGLTATPYRMGGKGLQAYYEDLIVGATPSMLVSEGFICEPKIFTVPEEHRPDLSKIKIKGGEYDENELAAACNTKKIVGSIVEHWREKSGGHRTIVFAINVEHSQRIKDEFLAAGLPAEHVDGTTPTPDRDAIIARLDRGETRIVVNCGVLTEGFDMPSVKCGVLARPTRSTGLFLQMAGRFLRPWEGVQPVILDHAGVVLEHGRPTADREFSISGSTRVREGTHVKTCPRCFAIVESSLAECSQCGLEFIAPKLDEEGNAGGPPAFEEADGQLVEYDAQAEMRKAWDRLCEVVEERQYSAKWADVQFKKMFHEWPPKNFPKPKGRPLNRAELVELEQRLTQTAVARNIPLSWVRKKIDAERARAEAVEDDIPRHPDDLTGDDDFAFGANA